MANERSEPPEPPSGTLTPFSYQRWRHGDYQFSRSFENLVALANYQERLKGARKMVWRDRGEPVADLNNLWDCAEHAAKGGLRAGTMAFIIRAGVNLVIAFIRMRSLPKRVWISLVQHAVLGKDSFRFAAMLGSFVAIYKYLINALPILFPKPSDKTPLPRFRIEDASTEVPTPEVPVQRKPYAERQPHLSLSAEARQILIRKKTYRWHSVLAGAVAGGLAITWETRSRRIAIAQQMFVRGLQGSYNAFAAKKNIHIPHGDVILFSLAVGQIIYAFVFHPYTLPPSYRSWLFQAGMLPPSIVNIHRGLVCEGSFDLHDLQRIIDQKNITVKNKAVLLERMAKASAPVPDFGPLYAPCAAVHPDVDSCFQVPFNVFLAVFKWMLPIYGTLHLLPAVLFKRKEFVKRPLMILLRASSGAFRSSSFLGALVIIYYAWFCGKHYVHRALTAIPATSPFKIPQRLVDSLASKFSCAVGGVMCGLSLLVEEKKRRSELAMYVLPKGMESAWLTARGKGWVFGTGEFGDIILTAIGMGMVMSAYQNDPQHLSSLVRRILYQFIGPN